ncbi:MULTISPECIES: urea ABC transporter ATP-binding protein UrtD [Nocardiopsidaceae]|uniref:Urea ABC transporter ATP-binding protein UrtD n=1 Tax=Streptomonospora nanhaiensis TaxID=1323731 RepID=A0ABY6YWD8_9ACTN|nr:urea ABC transporter ATP-binding protein UrtD [Streptomonospora nanhaiensis]WAE76175.1 urea ABC transporter ATP-binding protein UrtD [Streptomonospora nanhaiensis]
MTLLDIRDLTVTFGAFTALDHIDLTLDHGELRFLIGPNGAGKTTLIDTITGRTRPTSGTITFNGHTLNKRSEHHIVRAGIGRTFQTSVVFEHLTVADNVDLAASFRLRPWQLLRRPRTPHPEVPDLLERVGLTPHTHALAGTLSHGQRQWLEIAMLLAQHPRLLLLDEPVAGMSAAERTRTGELLTRIAADHTVVVIEHDMDFLRRYARQVTVLHEGRILTHGDLATVQNDPRVQEVYLGRTPQETRP